MIEEALASAVKGAMAAYEPSGEVQFLLMVIQALWGVILLIMGVFLGMMVRSLRDIQKDFAKLHDRLLTEFATKKEMVERSHGLRDSLGVHSTWIHLLAQKCDVNLPSIGSGTRKEDLNHS